LNEALLIPKPVEWWKTRTWVPSPNWLDASRTKSDILGYGQATTCALVSGVVFLSL